jgi:hypothetical protein
VPARSVRLSGQARRKKPCNLYSTRLGKSKGRGQNYNTSPRAHAIDLVTYLILLINGVCRRANDRDMRGCVDLDHQRGGQQKWTSSRVSAAHGLVTRRLSACIALFYCCVLVFPTLTPPFQLRLVDYDPSRGRVSTATEATKRPFPGQRRHTRSI